MKLDGSVLIRVGGFQQLLADASLGAELFPDLADEAGSVSFAAIAFSTWELPIARQVRSGQALRDKEIVILLDDSCHHDDGTTGWVHDCPRSTLTGHGSSFSVLEEPSQVELGRALLPERAVAGARRIEPETAPQPRLAAITHPGDP